jgi:hypothetical protein
MCPIQPIWGRSQTTLTRGGGWSKNVDFRQILLGRKYQRMWVGDKKSPKPCQRTGQ